MRLSLLACALLIPASTAGQTVRGRVLDTVTNAPVAGATVLSAGSTVLTDSRGSFAVPATAGSAVNLQITAFGYFSAVFSGQMPASGHLEAGDIALLPAPVAVDEVEVEGTALVPALGQVGFYERKRRGSGVFIEQAEIHKATIRSIGELLSRYGGMRAFAGFGPELEGEVGMTGNMTGAFDGPTGKLCLPAIYVDGVQRRRGGLHHPDQIPLRLQDAAQPSEIEAVEVYRSAAGVPPLFAGSDASCGVIAIWTRR